MHSPEFDDLCVLFSSGELPEARREEFARHRAECPECRALLDALAAGSRAAARAAISLTDAAAERVALRALGGVEPGEEPGAEPARARRALGARLQAAGLALAALGAVALLVSRPKPPSGKELAWTNGVEERMAQLSEDLSRLDASLAEPGWLIEEDLRRLENSAAEFERPLL